MVGSVRRRSLGRRLPSLLSVVLLAGLLPFMPEPAVAAGTGGEPQADRSVEVSAVKGERVQRTQPKPWRAAPVSFPQAASAVVDLPVQASGGRRGTALVGGLPVTVSSVDTSSEVQSGRALADAAAGRGAPEKVRVEVVDRAAAGRAGAAVALKLSRADGLSGQARVRVEIGYGDFHDAYGGDWAKRVGVVLLADCAVSTPDKDACKSRTRLESVNNASALTVSADVDLMAAPAATDADPLVDPSPVEEAPATVGLPSVQVTGEDTQIAHPPADPAVPEPAADAPSGSPAPVAEGAGDGSVMVALAAGASSETGTFAATQLSQTASWQGGGSAGGFSWSYMAL
ncbi:hypothetical protein [Catellatospora sichuanensis]|uniref:hypothetical protein n=1 Tax=Catellatospora sichuanensis TaxID=1969805 RepID=UPI0016428A0B|nr:hypothetical protein [Catellatospora sichuanensis]